MERAAAAYPQPQRGNLVCTNINTRRIRTRRRLDAMQRQHVDKALLHGSHKVAHAQVLAAQIQHQIGHQLPRAMIGHLPTTLDLDDRNITGRQHMFSLARLPLGKYPGVLQQPDFVGSIGATLLG